MRRKIKNIILIIIFILVLITNSTEVNAIYVTADISAPKKLKVGEKAKVEVKLNGPGSKTILEWVSSDSEIIECEESLDTSTTITACKVGTAKITVKYRCTNKGAKEDKSTTFEVTVRSNEVPGKDASVEEIFSYFEDLSNEDLLKNIDKEILIAWKTKVREYMKSVNDAISKGEIEVSEGEYEGFFKLFTLIDTLLTQEIDIQESGSSDITTEDIIEDYFFSFELDPDVYDKYDDYYLANVEGEDRVVHSDFKDVLNDTDQYKPNDENPPTEYYTIVSTIVSVITGIGTVVSVLIIAILGIKYMLGSVEEKAEYKKDMIPYLVCAVLLFGVSVIVGTLQRIGETINNI